MGTLINSRKTPTQEFSSQVKENLLIISKNIIPFYMQFCVLFYFGTQQGRNVPRIITIKHTQSNNVSQELKKNFPFQHEPELQHLYHNNLGLERYAIV